MTAAAGVGLHCSTADSTIVAWSGRLARLSATAEAEPELWARVSESYLTRGDLSGAVRARRAAIGGDPSATGWRRLAEIYDALERPDEAAAARATAASMAEGGRGAAVDRQPRGRRGVVS